jgi:plastocyanin
MFSPSEFTFSAGEEVTFVLTSESEFHTFTVDDLGIDVEIDGGETEQLTFTFDQPGEYTLICIPHELQGMTGTITVQ